MPTRPSDAPSRIPLLVVRPRRSRRAAGPPLLLVAILVLVTIVVFVTVSCGGRRSSGGIGAGFGGQPRLQTTVTRVIDGDTIAISLPDGAGTDVHVRLIGIDTPETKKPDTPVQCFGPEASARLEALLPVGTPLRLERDREEQDRYGRLLAYVYRGTDGLFVNQSLAAEGYARALAIPPNVTHRHDIDQATGAARQHRLGLWGACAATTGAPSG